MKIINATWEKRNFNMDTYEIILDKKDLRNFDETFLEIQNQNFKNAYVVIKMPVGNLVAIHKLEDYGYRFLETQIGLVDHFLPLQDDLFLSESKAVVYEEISKNKDEWEKIIKKITPDMFDTDRVSLDPFLGKEIASKRYQNWCRDLFQDENSTMLIIKYNDEICGFVIYLIDEKNNKKDGVLGGFFAEYKDMGMGLSWVNKTTNIKTSISSNNLSVFKIHQHCGRIVYKEKYVLRKIYN